LEANGCLGCFGCS